MKNLFSQFELVQKGLQSKVTSVCSHSQEVKPGCLFVALKGQKEDGHNYIPEVCKRGAQFLVVEEASSVPSSFKGTVIKTKDNYQALPLILNEFYDSPSEKLFLIGVTGTNGKTTTTYMVDSILNACGWATARIGTIDQHFQGKRWPSHLTTPNSVELFKRVKEFVDLSAQALVMEVSSIALDQKRVDGLDFNLGILQT